MQLEMVAHQWTLDRSQSLEDLVSTLPLQGARKTQWFILNENQTIINRYPYEAKLGKIAGDSLTTLKKSILPQGLTLIAQRPELAIKNSVRSLMRLNLAFFISTAFVIVVLGWAFHWQYARKEEKDSALQKEHLRLQTALNNGRCGLWDLNLKTGLIDWSPSMFEMLSKRSCHKSLTTKKIMDLIHPDDWNECLLANLDALSIGKLRQDTFRMKRDDGEWRWMQLRAEIVMFDNNQHLVGVAYDVTRSRQEAQAKEVFHERLFDAIEALPEAFVLCDDQKKIVMCNKKYRELYNLDPVKAEPGCCYDTVMSSAMLLHSNDVPARELDDTLYHDHFETHLEDGRWLQISRKSTRNGGFVSIGTDISDLKEQEVALKISQSKLLSTVQDLEYSRNVLEKQAAQLVDMSNKYAEEKEKALEANRIKSDFLANISHELRTPLNAIIGFSEVMESQTFGTLGCDRHYEYCRDIKESGLYLLGMVNDVLDMSRIESGQFTLEKSDIAIDELLYESLHAVAPAISKQSLELSNQIDKNLSLHADRRAMKQIILNLLSNAVKFTPAGGSIQVKAFEQRGAVHILIEDSGVGIAEDQIEKLGQPFEQVQSQFTKDHKGSGLGLAIARSLTELHHGNLYIYSQEGEGTLVNVILPVKTTHQHMLSLHELSS